MKTETFGSVRLSATIPCMRRKAAVALVGLAAIAILISPGHMTRYFPWQFYIPVAMLPLGLLLAAWWLIKSEAPPGGQDRLNTHARAKPSDNQEQ